MPSFWLQFPPSLTSCPLFLIPSHRSIIISRQLNRQFPAAASQNDIVSTPATKPDSESKEENTLPSGLRRDLMPNHVAVIMDGNRRWAQTRGLPVGAGYEAGFRAFRALVKLCCNWGISVLTVFAFSAENWFRPKVS